MGGVLQKTRFKIIKRSYHKKMQTNIYLKYIHKKNTICEIKIRKIT